MIIPLPIKESFIKQHQELIFVYAYDVARKGALGQCVVAIGNSNCYPVSTMWKSCKSSGYFQDGQDDLIEAHWRDEIGSIIKDGRLIILFPKIGMGNSRMQDFAPKLLKKLQSELNKIKWKEYEYGY